MDFWNKLGNTQKIILVVAVLVLVAAILMFCMKKEKMVPVPEGMEYDVHPNPKQDLPTSMYEGLYEGMYHETPSSEILEETDLVLTEEPDGSACLVLFYANWCPHCKHMLQAWDSFAQKMNGYKGINIMKIEEKEAPELMKKHNVRGYPVVKLCFKGLDFTDGIEYQGNRTAQDLEQFLLDNY